MTHIETGYARINRLLTAAHIQTELQNKHSLLLNATNEIITSTFNLDLMQKTCQQLPKATIILHQDRFDQYIKQTQSTITHTLNHLNNQLGIHT